VPGDSTCDFLSICGISGAAQSLPNSSSGLTSFDQVEMQIYLDRQTMPRRRAPAAGAGLRSAIAVARIQAGITGRKSQTARGGYSVEKQTTMLSPE